MKARSFSLKKWVNKSFEPIIFILLTIFTLLLLFTNSGNAVKEGLELWFACVVPSLFPYLFVTSIFSGLKLTSRLSRKLSPLTSKLFKVNGNVGYAFIMSAIAGYPIGSKTVSDLKINGQLSETEAIRASAFCSLPSPMFLIGSVGGIMFNNKLFGVLLYLCNLLSAIIIGFIFSFYKRKESATFLSFSSVKSKENLLYESAYSAVISILVVGSLITIFYLLTYLLEKIGVLTPINWFFELIFRNREISKGFTFGLFECTKGLKVLSSTKTCAFSIVAFITAFGGFSAIAQSTAYLKKAKIKTAPFIISKIIGAVICSVLASIISLFGIV